MNLTREARKVADAIYLWCEDPYASAVILGSISANLTALCREASWHAAGYVEEADANPERRNNGCLIYKVGS